MNTTNPVTISVDGVLADGSKLYINAETTFADLKSAVAAIRNAFDMMNGDENKEKTFLGRSFTNQTPRPFNYGDGA